MATATKNGTTNIYKYNDSGIRTSKKVGNVEHVYTLNGSQIVSETWSNNTLVYLYDETGSPIGMQYRTSSMEEGEFVNFFFEKNLFGDIVGVYNESGIKVLSYYYDAWGNHTPNVLNSTGNNTYAQYNPFRYRGYYYDTDTGLYYLQSRYYNPYWGRFINADVYINANGDLIGYNMYAYCSNNPVMYTDSTGSSIWSDLVNIIKEIPKHIGINVSADYEITTSETYYFWVTHEKGTGYSKNLSTDTELNTFWSSQMDSSLSPSSTFGVDINIKGFGAGIEIGGDTSIGLHLGGLSLDVGLNSGNLYFQNSVAQDNGTYYHEKLTFNSMEILCTAFVLYGICQLASKVVAPIVVAPLLA